MIMLAHPTPHLPSCLQLWLRAFLLILASGLPFAAGAQDTGKENVLLNTRIGVEGQQFGSSFRLITRQALESFDIFRVHSAHPDYDWAQEAQRARMIATGRQLELPYVVTAVIQFKRRNKASLELQFISTTSGRTTLTRTLEFDYESLPALMAQIEYALEQDLKRQFRKLGEVVAVQGDRVYFDLGGSAGVKAGDLYRIFTRGRELSSRAAGSFGFLDDNTGIVRVTGLKGSWAQARVLLGQRNIRPGHLVEQAPGNAEDYTGQVMAKLNDEVAISLGRKTGIEPGAEFAVQKKLAPIDDRDAFQVEVSRIRITSVEDDYARGYITRSDHYELSRGLVEPGDSVVEVRRSGGAQLDLGQIYTGLSDTPQRAWVGRLTFQSPGNQSLLYRIGAGYRDFSYWSFGLLGAANHSESFFYGLDAVYTDTLGANLIASARIPTPFPDAIRLYSDVGYMISNNDSLSGLNLSVGVNLRSPGF